MSDSWEIIKKPTKFYDFVHKYIVIYRLRQVRDFNYAYRASNPISQKYNNSKLEDPLLGPTPKEEGNLVKFARELESYLNNYIPSKDTVCCCYKF